MTQRLPSTSNAVLSEEGAIVGVDLGKTVFQLCIADGRWRVVDAKRLTRPRQQQLRRSTTQRASAASEPA